jgi:general stress protein 26
MNEIEGLKEAFVEAKVVFLTTYRDGEERNRQITNFNEEQYKMMWFPTDRDSQKVRDIEEDSKVLLTFPSLREGEHYEIEGRAEFEKDAVTAQKWKWWYLYWHPAQRKRFWLSGSQNNPNRMIINVYPQSARKVKGSE